MPESDTEPAVYYKWKRTRRTSQKKRSFVQQHQRFDNCPIGSETITGTEMIVVYNNSEVNNYAVDFETNVVASSATN